MHMLSLILIGAAPAEQSPFFLITFILVLGIAAIKERVSQHLVHSPAYAKSTSIPRVGDRSKQSGAKLALLLICDRDVFSWSSRATHQIPDSCLLHSPLINSMFG